MKKKKQMNQQINVASLFISHAFAYFSLKIPAAF